MSLVTNDLVPNCHHIVTAHDILRAATVFTLVGSRPLVHFYVRGHIPMRNRTNIPPEGRRGFGFDSGSVGVRPSNTTVRELPGNEGFTEVDLIFCVNEGVLKRVDVYYISFSFLLPLSISSYCSCQLSFYHTLSFLSFFHISLQKKWYLGHVTRAFGLTAGLLDKGLENP